MISIRPKVALMSYAMDNRSAKGIALYTRKLIEGLVSSNEIDFYLVHYDEVMDPLYKKAHEIIMPKVRLPYGSRGGRHNSSNIFCIFTFGFQFYFKTFSQINRYSYR